MNTVSTSWFVHSCSSRSQTFSYQNTAYDVHNCILYKFVNFRPGLNISSPTFLLWNANAKLRVCKPRGYERVFVDPDLDLPTLLIFAILLLLSRFVVWIATLVRSGELEYLYSSKGFNTINHAILINKLNLYGARGTTCFVVISKIDYSLFKLIA